MAMESEKAMYWVTLGVLALATTTGFVTEHRGWGGWLVERSIAMVSQASETGANYAKNYAEIAGQALGYSEDQAVDSPQVVVDIQKDVESDVQTTLACARNLARHQAEFGRLQAMKFRLRTVGRVPRTIVVRNRNMVIDVPDLDVPQGADLPED